MDDTRGKVASWPLSQCRLRAVSARIGKTLLFDLRTKKWSERQDLNLRRLGPKPSALARLSYAPTLGAQYPLFWCSAQRLSQDFRIGSWSKVLVRDLLPSDRGGVASVT